jgi:hypothetical protein
MSKDEEISFQIQIGTNYASLRFNNKKELIA